MKKALIYILVVVFVIAGIAFIHYANKPKQAPDVIEALAEGTADQAADRSSAPVKTGDSISFNVEYRGISGKDDDLRVNGSYGFGTRRDEDVSAFYRQAQDATDYQVAVAYNPYLTDREYAAIEYRDRQVLALYFDVDGNGTLSDDERLLPSDVSDQNQRYTDAKAFVTPDFTVTNNEGQQVPFRVVLWARFYDGTDTPRANWWPMGLYEGTVDMGRQTMKFYLFPDFYAKSYTDFGRSDYALVSPDEIRSDYVPRRSLSSLIVHGKTFYRVAVKPADADGQTLTVTLAEDKSPRGTLAFKVQGAESLKHEIASATLRGAGDNTINFSVGQGMNELPVGDYVISSGYLRYGVDSTDAYSTNVSNIGTFTIKEDQATTVEFGKPRPEMHAVELNKRYNSDVEYKTEFPEGTPVYIDVAFTGTAGETYRGFRKQVQMQNYTTNQYMNAQLSIVDENGNTIVTEELEPG